MSRPVRLAVPALLPSLHTVSRHVLACLGGLQGATSDDLTRVMGHTPDADLLNRLLGAGFLQMFLLAGSSGSAGTPVFRVSRESDLARYGCVRASRSSPASVLTRRRAGVTGEQAAGAVGGRGDGVRAGEAGRQHGSVLF